MKWLQLQGGDGGEREDGVGRRKEGREEQHKGGGKGSVRVVGRAA